MWLQVHIYSKSTHTFVQMARGQPRGCIRKRITVLRMEALNEACPVPTIKQKLSVRPVFYAGCKSASTPAVHSSLRFIIYNIFSKHTTAGVFKVL